MIVEDQWSLLWNAVDHTWSVLITASYREPYCHILSTDEHVPKKICQLIMSRRHCLALDGGKQLIRWESSDFEVIVQDRGLTELSTVEQSGRGVYSTWAGWQSPLDNYLKNWKIAGVYWIFALTFCSIVTCVLCLKKKKPVVYWLHNAQLPG